MSPQSLAEDEIFSVIMDENIKHPENNKHDSEMNTANFLSLYRACRGQWSAFIHMITNNGYFYKNGYMTDSSNYAQEYTNHCNSIIVSTRLEDKIHYLSFVDESGEEKVYVESGNILY